MAKRRASRPARTSPEVRVSYPTVFEPRAAQDGQDKKYNVTLMFDKKNEQHMAFLRLLKKDAEECLAEHWPDSETRPKRPVVGATKSPIKDGDTTVDDNDELLKNKNPEYAGHYLIRATKKPKSYKHPETKEVVYSPMTVVDRSRRQISNPDDVYGGCYCYVNLNAYTFELPTNKGVTFGLNGLQKSRDGDSFGGGGPSNPESMFEAHDPEAAGMFSGDDDEDLIGVPPISTEDDDIPF